jgi:peptidoglycan/LPS O-acetylase OafA/YrhL
MRNRDPGRYDHVDSLRGIAALLVIWLHVCEVFTRLPLVNRHGDLLAQIADIIDVGRMGVVIFFAISGFVICPSLRGATSTGTWIFVVKRFFRLYPAYWIAIVTGSFAVWQLAGKPLSAGLYAANATMIPTLFGYQNMMGLLWTLETELVFYLLCLLLFWCRALQNPIALCIASLSMLLLFAGFRLHLLPAPELPAWEAMPYHLAIMFWGGLARHCYENAGKHISVAGYSLRLTHLLAALAAAILMPLAAMALLIWHNTGHTKELTLAAAYSLAMAMFVTGVFIVRLRHRVLVWLGTISYSMYLFHSIFFTPMYAWCRQHQDHPLAQLHMGVYLAVIVVITVVFSDLVYRWVEAPSNRLARRLVSRHLPNEGRANV